MKYQKITALLLCVCLYFSFFALPIKADDGAEPTIEPSWKTNEELLAAIAAGQWHTVDAVIAQHNFTNIAGHGFAAEQGNNLIDTIRGFNAVVVGDNNVANGPDRLILNRNGTTVFIQDKYYSTAYNTIEACFDKATGLFRYMNADGTPMQIEVPADQYAESVKLMEERIRDGRVAGVTNPEDAKSMVRKGSLSYQQAKNLAKAGTLESLTYDSVNGAISAGCAFGISTLINYTVNRINGDERSAAIKGAALSGVKSGAGAFCVTVIAGQLSKTGIMNVFKPTTEALTKALGDRFSEMLLNAYGQSNQAAVGGTAQSVTKQAASLIRTQALIAAVTVIVFSVPDAVNLFRGRISQKQFVKNFAVSAVSVVAGIVGYGAGGTLGNLVVPGVGTIPGWLVGTIIAGAASMAASYGADLIADYITSDDADEMYEIVINEFAKNCEAYLLSEEETEEVIQEFSKLLTDSMYKDMYQSEDREFFINSIMEPLFEAKVSSREVMSAPTEAEMRYALKEELQGTIFIH